MELSKKKQQELMNKFIAEKTKAFDSKSDEILKILSGLTAADALGIMNLVKQKMLQKLRL